MSLGLSKQGFTLMEVLIALAIFTLVSSITASIMLYAFNTSDRVRAHGLRLTELELSMAIMERAFSQAIERAIRTPEGGLLPTFSGDASLVEFTQTGMANPGFSEKKSDMARVAFVCHKDSLLYRQWARLDFVTPKIFSQRVLLRKLKRCRLNYLGADNQRLSDWPIINQPPLPRAVELNLSFKTWGDFNYLFILPSASYRLSPQPGGSYA